MTIDGEALKLDVLKRVWQGINNLFLNLYNLFILKTTTRATYRNVIFDDIKVL
jgi:hypothetical protein